MSQTSRTVRTVTPGDWVASYFIGVAALALALALVVNLILLASSQAPWQRLLDSVSFSVALLLVAVVVIGVIAALPCILFFWLAQRFTWHHLWIYLLGGALMALPTIPVVVSLSPSLFNAYGLSILARYSPLAPLFSVSGAFLGAIFWWRSGRHLRSNAPCSVPAGEETQP